MRDWDIAQARELYNMAYWGNGYFDISPEGHLLAYPDGDQDKPGVDLHKLASELKAAGLTLPVLVRFSDILRHRVATLCNAFAQAMRDDGYQGHYTAVYPIKVNQQRRVVEEILVSGAERVGLEAGSKPELLAVLALSKPNGVVVCNGYKDREYIRLALIGQKLGHRVYIVVEKLSELDLIIEESRALQVRPLIGVRVRLASAASGKWQNSGGEKSKFGLSSTQILALLQHLREVDMLDCLQLQHFHLGSQIANIQDIKRGMGECARFYAELRRLGASIRVVDVGGGLSVDYEGTRSRAYCSMNYSVQEYANDVVHALWEICAQENLPHPDIISESGRAMTAHHAMLITNIVDIERAPGDLAVNPLPAQAPQILQDLWFGLQNLSSRSVLEAFHDANYLLGEAQGMFNHGMLTLEQRAWAEQIYFATCHRVRELLSGQSRAQRELLDELNNRLVDKYFGNFSLFQSLPDSWAINQIFPILPLHRLNERPERRVTLQDITCDSDGQVDDYVAFSGIEPSLPLHAIQPQQPYLIGIFMVGAYQEILGDMHNLFGDTDSVHVELRPDGGHRLVHPQQGDTVDSVLRYVHFDADTLLNAFGGKIDAHPELSDDQRQEFLREIGEGLRGYTYLED
ncbi:biosynthetic arginine decarboxylase [Thermithiobacillus plumbiphilus]|uniref:Biosynthetic arginine decarboxylase n=1 Tax=Thermithiobacillus plumbiphilus TaxID=1729899 RepID=A0ABU9DA82_9PROT